MTNILPVIMAGGCGTRLWPLSRQAHPKQFLSLHGERSLLQQTLERLIGLTELKPVVICNEEHRFLAAGQLQEMGAEADILLEPVGKNTAPTLTLAALHAQRQQVDKEPPVLLVLPADHVIQDVTAFQQAIRRLMPQVEAGKLGTLGVLPTRADTGYGYIKTSVMQGDDVQAVAQFVEKPDAVTAQAYLAAGGYFWNSGIFMVRADICLGWMQRFCSAIYLACQQAMASVEKDHDFTRIDATAFSACPSDSIDYALAEPLSREADRPVVVTPFDGGWSDVGTWSALWELKAKDALGNVMHGEVHLKDCADGVFWSDGRLVGALGLENVVVVDTADALLVAHKDRAQDIKQLVETLKIEGREEYHQHREVYRPWGKYDAIDQGERYQVKRITVKAGASLSLQKHHHRAEHWVVVSGTAKVTRGDEIFMISENQSTYIPIGEVHRLENPGVIPLEIIEVQSGTYLGEDDIVRLQDNYGRE